MALLRLFIRPTEGRACSPRTSPAQPWGSWWSGGNRSQAGWRGRWQPGVRAAGGAGRALQGWWLGLSAIPPPPTPAGPEQCEPAPSTVSPSGLGGGEVSPPSPCCGGALRTSLSTGFRDLQGARVPPRVEPRGPCPPLSQGSTWALGHQAPSSARPNSGPCLAALPPRGGAPVAPPHPTVGGGYSPGLRRPFYGPEPWETLWGAWVGLRVQALEPGRAGGIS